MECSRLGEQDLPGLVD